MPDSIRRQLDGRPLLAAGIGLVIGLTALGHPANWILLAAAWFVLIRLAARGSLLAGAAVGLLLAPSAPSPLMDRTFVDADGMVVSVARPSPHGETFNLTTSDRTWRVAAPPGAPPALGDRVHVVGVGLPLREGSEDNYLLHGISGRLDASRIEVVSPGPGLWRVAQSWRLDFRAFCRRWMSPSAASLTEALCFDLNAGVDVTVTDRLKEIGALHVLVASGMHVLLLAAASLWLLGRLPIPRGVQIAVLACVLALYCGATGLTPAVVRASLMTVVGVSAYFFRREPDALSALALAGLVYLLWHPRDVYDPGFQLSFITVGGIFLFHHPPTRAARPVVRFAFEFIGVGWVAFVASAPLMAYYFGTLSTVSLPANLAIGAAASVGLLSAFAAHAIATVLPSVGVGILTSVTEPMAGWVLFVSERLGGQPWSSVAVPAFSPYWLVVIYGLLLLTWRPRIVQP